MTIRVVGRGERAGRLGVALLVSSFGLSCDLLAPELRDTYDLITVEGVPLPHILESGIEGGTGDLIQLVQTTGSLTFFSGGRYERAATYAHLRNGSLDPAWSPNPRSGNSVYDYRLEQDTVLLLTRGGWRAVRVDGGNRLLVTDLTGLYHGDTYEYRRP